MLNEWPFPFHMAPYHLVNFIKSKSDHTSVSDDSFSVKNGNSSSSSTQWRYYQHLNSKEVILWENGKFWSYWIIAKRKDRLPGVAGSVSLSVVVSCQHYQYSSPLGPKILPPLADRYISQSHPDNLEWSIQSEQWPFHSCTVSYFQTSVPSKIL